MLRKSCCLLVELLKLNIFSYLRKPKVNPFAEKLSHPILKAIFKYSKHRSFIVISNITNG